MSRYNKIILFIFLFAGFILLFGFWYKYTYSMEIAKSFQVNSPSYNTKLLIATQGSDFKNELTNLITEHYKNDSIFIQTIDISSLDSVDETMYNAILIIHTWENWKPPEAVEKFINKLSEEEKNKLIVMTTSGQGTYKMEGIDAITGESDLNTIELISDQIIEKLNLLLKSKMQ